jgi:hypothetical protein
MRDRVPVAVVALVLLAGCGSATGPATPGTATVTPAPVPTATPALTPTAPGTPTATPTPAPASSELLPPGVAASGVANVTALARAHRAALEGRSYRAVSVLNRSTADGWERTRRVVRVDGDRTHLVSRTRESDGNRSSRVGYVAGHERAARCERTGGSGPCATGPASAVDGDAAGTVLVLLSGSESRLVGTESRVAGTDRNAGTLRHRLVVSGTPFGLGSPYGTLEARNYSATALVTPSGLVTEVRAEYDLVGGGARIRVSVRLRFSDLGAVRVTPPPWYGEDGTDGREGNGTGRVGGIDTNGRGYHDPA